MKIILKKDLKGVGKSGDVLMVADGYGRNYLVPSGFAEAWDVKIEASLTQKKAALKEKSEKALMESRRFVEKLAAGALEFRLKADEKGHLYAGLKEEEISAKIREGLALDIEIEIVHYQPIKETGSYKCKVKIGENSADLNIIVFAANEKEQKKR